MMQSGRGLPAAAALLAAKILAVGDPRLREQVVQAQLALMGKVITADKELQIANGRS